DIYQGDEGVSLQYDAATGQNIDNTATVHLPSYSLINNVIARHKNAGLKIEAMPDTAVDVIHNTIVSATHTSGIGVEVLTGTVRLTNTIIASHTVGISNTVGTVSENYSLFAGNGANIAGTVATGTNSLYVTDPGFTDPSQNNYRLVETSPAVNAAINAGVSEDRDRKSRPIGAGYDIGAYEFGDSNSIYFPLIMKASSS
ncbi:MAG: choice-of-anchor Q domain-containing protein, partial [Chloroflexota bacterium]